MKQTQKTTKPQQQGGQLSFAFFTRQMHQQTYQERVKSALCRYEATRRKYMKASR